MKTHYILLKLLKDFLLCLKGWRLTMTNDITEQENRLAMAIGAKYAEEFSSDIQTSRVADSFPLPFCYTSSGSAICFAKIIIENVALAENLNIEITLSELNDIRMLGLSTGLPCLILIKWGCGSVGSLDVSTPLSNLYVRNAFAGEKGSMSIMEPVASWEPSQFQLIHK